MEKIKLSNIVKRIREIRLPSVSFKLSSSIIILTLISASVFILGGGVYDIMNNPVFHPEMTTSERQAYMTTFNDGLSFMFFLVIGIAGGLLAFRSTRYAYRPREARMFLLIGVTMLVIAFIGCELLLMKKGY